MTTSAHIAQAADRDAIYGHAHERRRAGDLQGAIRLMYVLLERDTSDGEVLRDLACLLAETDQLAQAERTFRHALKLRPGDPHLQVNFGVFLAQSDRHDEARKRLLPLRAAFDEQLTAALAQDDDEPVREALGALGIVDMTLARSYCCTDEPDRALERLLPYLKHPEWWQAADALACDCAGDDEEDELELAERLHAAHKASPLMVWRLAEREADRAGDLAALARVIVDAAPHLPPGLLAEVVEEHDHAAGLKRSCATELQRRSLSGDAAAAELLALFTAVLQPHQWICPRCVAEARNDG